MSGANREGGDRTIKRHEGTVGSDGNILYIDCSCDFVIFDILGENSSDSKFSNA